ncbi:MAG: outer membrane protein transport protein [Bacteriovoracales bacterium]|nr:outer membrane protein transport protein [Bacteriovoracales bacterium]
MMKLSLLFLALTLGGTGLKSFAGGYEKAVGWSGQWSSLGGAAGAAASGADALYFNPAGLIHGPSRELSVNLSPTWSTFEGPNTPTEGQSETSERALSPMMGLLYKQGLNVMGKDFSLGVGFYGVGGTNVTYENVKFNDDVTRPKIESDLKIVEASLGLSWAHSENLSFGVSWRMLDVSAEIQASNALAGGNNVLTVGFKDLKDTQHSGFRIGAQYMSDDKRWGTGLSLRNSVGFKLEGQSEGALSSGTTDIPAPGGDLTLESALPLQASVGFFYKKSNGGTFFQETTYTAYSENEKITATGDDIAFPALLGGPQPPPTVTQNWKDQWSLKLGYEDSLPWRDLTYRVGYVVTTAVTPEDHARATRTPPGTGHTLTAGVGKELGEGKYAMDLGLEYSMASGDGQTSEMTGIQRAEGKFSANAYALHGSFKYRF